MTEGGLSAGEASMRLSLPKSTLENWLRAFKVGKLERIGANHRPLTDVEMELARVKRELALVRMERDIFNNSRFDTELGKSMNRILEKTYALEDLAMAIQVLPKREALLP